MKIIILNANDNPEDHSFDEFMKKYELSIVEKDQSVTTFMLRDMDINYCTGCWTCWWKTPGLCVFKDNMEYVYREITKSDLLVFASPLKTGFISSLLKKTMDRMVPLLHPYIKIINNECHHKKRYPNYPDIGLIFQKEKDTDKEDLNIIKKIYERFALNFHSKVKFMLSTNKLLEETVNATIHI